MERDKHSKIFIYPYQQTLKLKGIFEILETVVNIDFKAP